MDAAHRFAFEQLVAARLRARRMNFLTKYGKEFSQRAVSRRLRRSQTWLSNLENGQRRLDVVELRVFSALYNVPVYYFTGPPRNHAETLAYARNLQTWADSHPMDPAPPVMIVPDERQIMYWYPEVKAR